ncbi:hypothetical protein [Endozoicomonas euniceicola]|uniref:Uncharacterized protein n=1 Tax=Endozoicomonas euniceicola TaxID=1234143 RepID=A0ABY6GY34_9GAMM|nr:hypothetical protein [Endozoicomonas euniceicola]UYM17304.1 hypothetical protein NX720_05105 [Endozoicomonas euniceicola]
MNGTPTTVNSSIPCQTVDHREQQEKLPEITISTTGQGSLAGAARALPANNKRLPESTLSTPSKNIHSDRTTRRLTTTDPERISQCATAIKQAFPLPTTELTKENTAKAIGHYFYSNDYSKKYRKSLNFPAMIADMAKRPETQSKSPRIGLVIGQSSLPDAAPEFARHCDIVLIVDNDPLLLSSIEKRMDLLIGCELEEEDYYKHLNSYIFDDLMSFRRDKFYYDYIYSIKNLNTELDNARKALGQHWAFSSQERLTEVKEAVKKTHFIPVYGNIFSKKFLESMGGILTSHDALVHVLNLTNVFEYHPKTSPLTPYDTEDTIGKPSELADRLKICPQALIHSSRMLRFNQGSRFGPPADHFQTLDDLLLEDIKKPGMVF